MRLIILLVVSLLSPIIITAQDQNFHIYICIGQSNMHGNAMVEEIDKQNVPSRFKVMSTLKFTNPPREKGEWYTAVPPLVSQSSGLSPMDYFGRTMVNNLPEEIKIGVIPVAVPGCRIEHLDKDFNPASLAGEADWFISIMESYGKHPYNHLIEHCRKAQKDGVIKGILLHQGESNNGDSEWTSKVKKIYEDILSDLNLNAKDVPLIAGELVSLGQGGICGGMNSIINTLPKTIPTAHVVSSINVPQVGDGLHFSAHGYRVLGCRYATAMLATMGIENPRVEYSEEIPVIPRPNPAEGDFTFGTDRFNPSIWEHGEFDPKTNIFIAGLYGFGGWQYEQPIDISGYKYVVAELEENETNGVEFKIFDSSNYWGDHYKKAFKGEKLIVANIDELARNSGSNIVPLKTDEIYIIGFWAYGHKPIHLKRVYLTNENPYTSVTQIPQESEIKDGKVYDLTGRLVAPSLSEANLPAGIYIVNRQKIVIK